MKRLLVLVPVLALLLAGCSISVPFGARAVSDTAPKVGQCVKQDARDGEDVAPDFTTVVACTRPHVYEVTAVVKIPSKYLVKGSIRKRLARRTELAVVDDSKRTALASAFIEDMGARCSAASFDHLSGGDFSISGKSAADVGASIVTTGSDPWVNLSSASQWRAGNEVMVCSQRFSESSSGSSSGGTDTVAAPAVPKANPVTSDNRSPVIEQYFTADFPLDQRQCFTSTDNTYTPVACSSAHSLEYLWAMDAAALSDTSLSQSDADGFCVQGYESLGFTPAKEQQVVAFQASSQSSYIGCGLKVDPTSTTWHAFTGSNT